MPSIKMFQRSHTSKDRAGKATKPSKRSFRDATKQQMLNSMNSPPVGGISPNLTSAIITLVVGRDQRLFAAHEDVLSHSPYFGMRCRGQYFDAGSRRIDLPDEEPEVFSCVLEYLYKGDYTPRLVHDKRRNTWMLERDDDGVGDAPDTPNTNRTGGRGGAGKINDKNNNNNSGGGVESSVFHSGVGNYILRDTAVYCAAERYGLEELKRVALRKQGLCSGIDVGTILRSARYAYAHTPDSDSRLRAHYLALIIRSRRTFKRSGTMQMEMEQGGKLFFDLFVAMCNHVDDIVDLGNSRSPKTI